MNGAHPSKWNTLLGRTRYATNKCCSVIYQFLCCTGVLSFFMSCSFFSYPLVDMHKNGKISKPFNMKYKIYWLGVSHVALQTKKVKVWYNSPVWKTELILTFLVPHENNEPIQSNSADLYREFCVSRVPIHGSSEAILRVFAPFVRITKCRIPVIYVLKSIRLVSIDRCWSPKWCFNTMSRAYKLVWGYVRAHCNMRAAELKFTTNCDALTNG